jgi:hypothetical protein
MSVYIRMAKRMSRAFPSSRHPCTPPVKTNIFIVFLVAQHYGVYRLSA